jgi:hypothetical protein
MCIHLREIAGHALSHANGPCSAVLGYWLAISATVNKNKWMQQAQYIDNTTLAKPHDNNIFPYAACACERR